MEVDGSEYRESTTYTFEWTLKGLKNLFDSTKGDSKSKVTKSARFGDGRWQILFYPNAGAPKEGSAASESGYVSLYLSCEPTTEEKEAALADGGKWVREGVYKFNFELRNLGKTVLYNLKEANNHSFSHKTGNWGWAQFAKRDTVYYQSNGVKVNDAFVIICSITSSPAPPPTDPSQPKQSVPKELLDTVGALLDDPLYSDVEFIVPGRRRKLKWDRKICASRRLLQRAEYFASMFSSGFAEGTLGDSQTLAGDPQAPSVLESDADLVMDEEFEDSDDEEDGIDEDMSHTDPGPSSSQASLLIEASTVSPLAVADNDEITQQGEHRNVRAKLSHPSSPRSTQSTSLLAHPTDPSSSAKLTVVVKDVAYTTYMALLYYLYTDTIVFAPLSSSFLAKKKPPVTPLPGLGNSPPSTPSDEQENFSAQKRSTQDSVTSRREWIQEWKKDHPGRPAPCSAKAVYRLADRYDMRGLKERASQHIIKSLAVENIAYEVFSPFAAVFDDIRRTQVNFFLSHWKEIRASDSMRNVWQQIRNGRHPGFEEVWPTIVLSLEFQPPHPSSGDKTEVGGDISH